MIYYFFFLVTSLCKIQGVKCIKRKRLGDALAWAIKAQDGAFATYIADEFLKRYAENGEIECRDLLENLGASMLTSDRLTFLGKIFLNFLIIKINLITLIIYNISGKYCEFHQWYGMGEFKEAARQLVSLIISNLTPK